MNNELTTVFTQTNRYEHSTSEKYKVINTDNIRQVLEDQGFQLVKTGKANTKRREGFQRHIMRFTKPEFVEDDEQLEVLVTNSHDGSSSLKISVGIFRFACANGIVVGDTAFEHRVRHVGNWEPKVVAALDNIAENYQLIKERITKYKNTDTDYTALRGVIHKLMNERVNDYSPAIFPTIIRKRPEDSGSDLWTVLNVVQEALIRGGARYTNTEGKSKRVRPISNIDRVQKFNKLIWNEFDKLAV